MFVLYPHPIPPVPRPPPCSAGDTTAPSSAALLLPAAGAGGFCMGNGPSYHDEALQGLRTATSGGAWSAAGSDSGGCSAAGHVQPPPLRVCSAWHFLNPSWCAAQGLLQVRSKPRSCPLPDLDAFAGLPLCLAHDLADARAPQGGPGLASEIIGISGALQPPPGPRYS